MVLPWEVSDLHPHALSLMDEDALGAEFAVALHADLDSMNPPPVIHRYRCVLPEGCETETLIEAGFHVTRLTRIVDLPVSAADHALLRAPMPTHIAPHWFRTDERAPWDTWVAAHWQHYQALHFANPAAEPACGLNAVFVGDDLVEGLALREGPQGRIRAFASLRTGDEIGWIGGVPDLIPLALGACLRRATALGWSRASLEVDDDDAPLWALLDGLGQPVTQTYVTWQLERAAAKRPS